MLGSGFGFHDEIWNGPSAKGPAKRFFQRESRDVASFQGGAVKLPLRHA